MAVSLVAVQMDGCSKWIALRLSIKITPLNVSHVHEGLLVSCENLRGINE